MIKAETDAKARDAKAHASSSRKDERYDDSGSGDDYEDEYSTPEREPRKKTPGSAGSAKNDGREKEMDGREGKYRRSGGGNKGEKL
jgi:hypothetical protein